MKAWFGAALGPTTAVEGLLAALTLMIIAIAALDHLTDREALGTSMLDDQDFIDVQVWYDLRLFWHQGWPLLEWIKVHIFIIVVILTQVRDPIAWADGHQSISLGHILDENIVAIDSKEVLLHQLLLFLRYFSFFPKLCVHHFVLIVEVLGKSTGGHILNFTLENF